MPCATCAYHIQAELRIIYDMPSDKFLVHIDGAMGEGGGQVLRSALALSIIRQQPFHIENIRANRSKPGLKAQHLKAIDAAAAISKARVEGATLNATSITFSPSEIRTGRYKFDIVTAGATTLVLQTIFLPLSFAKSASTVIITGGTHVPWSPCFHYAELHWLPFLRQMGFDAQISLQQAGFYPQGGGRITSTIRPAHAIRPLQLIQRGKLVRIAGISAIANLPASIAERQKRQAVQRLMKSVSEAPTEIRIEINQLPSPVKGTLLLLLAEFEVGRCCYFALGELHKPAEQVADEAVDALLAFLDTNGAVDQYLADQLLLPLCFAGGVSEIRTSQVTEHLLTNAAILRMFTPAVIDIQGELGQPGLIRIIPQDGP
jgi:RNA 3'-terminal phosphate cyclase (ATP)